MCLGLEAFGYSSVVLGDLKPDYAELVAAMGGKVVSLGAAKARSTRSTPGGRGHAAGRLTGRARRSCSPMPTAGDSTCWPP